MQPIYQFQPELFIDEKHLVEALFIHASIGIIVANQQGEIILANPFILRTPLSTILSSTYLLQKYATTEEQAKREKHIERIISSVNTLTDILNDFLSVISKPLNRFYYEKGFAY